MLFCGLNVCLHVACLQPNEAVGFSCHWFATQCAVWRKSAAQTGWAERRNCLMRSLSLCSTLKLFPQSLCLSHLIHAHTHTCVSEHHLSLAALLNQTCCWLFTVHASHRLLVSAFLSSFQLSLPALPPIICALAQSRQEGAWALAWILYIALICTFMDPFLASGKRWRQCDVEPIEEQLPVWRSMRAVSHQLPVKTGHIPSNLTYSTFGCGQLINNMSKNFYC